MLALLPTYIVCMLQQADLNGVRMQSESKTIVYSKARI